MKNNIEFKNIKVKGDIFTSNDFIKKSILENSNIKVTAFKVKLQDEFIGILSNKKEIKELNEIINKKVFCKYNRSYKNKGRDYISGGNKHYR